MSRRSWRKSGDHQGEQACHRRTPDREPQPGHPRLGELSSSRGKQADLLTSGPRDLSCVMAVGQTEAPQEVQTMDQRPILRDHRPTALGLTRHSRRLGGGHPTGLAPRRLKCADPATYQGQRGSESLRPRLGTVLRGTSRREDGRDPGGPMDSAAALEGARRYLSGLQPEDHHGDGVAQPPYRVANPWGQGYDREPRAGASELPSTDPQPRVRCGKAASCKGRSRGLSCMKGNFHVQFLGEGVAATSPPYPTLGWATTQVYPARITGESAPPDVRHDEPPIVQHPAAPTPAGAAGQSLKEIATAVGAVAAVAYGAGYIVTTMHLYWWFIYNPTLVNGRYVSVGFCFLWIAAVTLLPAYYLIPSLGTRIRQYHGLRQYLYDLLVLVLSVVGLILLSAVLIGILSAPPVFAWGTLKEMAYTGWSLIAYQPLDMLVGWYGFLLATGFLLRAVVTGGL